MKIAFDIDDTLYKVRYKEDLKPRDQVPDYDIIQVLRWFYNNGDEIFFWSAGGVDYAQQIVNKLGLDEYGKVIDKNITAAGHYGIDITFDDQEVKLARTNIKVKRWTPEED